jgi:hypothetical protein
MRLAFLGLWHLVIKEHGYRPSDIDDTAFLRLISGFKTSKEYLNHLRRREKPVFFSLTDPGTIKAFQNLYPGARPQIISAADRICDHVFDLLGSGPKKLSKNGSGYQPIDWHTDFKSSHTWDKSTFYRDIQYGRQAGVDVKVPWELSRCQHFPALGQAYLLTGSEKYAHEFVNEVEDWIENNKTGYGVNWACAMDVAIRAVNWCWGFYYFRTSSAISDEFLSEFVKSLYQHGLFIMSNLEKDPLERNSNHYLSDLAGLAYLGTLLPELKEARRWRDYAYKEIVAEAKKQIYPDGVDYEGSISYHRLVVEIFLSVTLLGIANSIKFPDWYLKRLEKAIEFIQGYSKSDGKALQIGDSDDGRLHILNDYGGWDRADHRYLLALGASWFKRPDFKAASGSFHAEAFWLLGEEGKKKYDTLAGQSANTSVAFAPGGFYVMRKGALYLMMDCVNPNAKAPPGHRHNSRLSFDLFAYDKTFIVDPGTYLYTPDPTSRNLFRSTAYHNTVVVDGTEQNTIKPEILFDIGTEARVKVNSLYTTEKIDILDAEHSGYRRLANPVTHRRQVYFDKTESYWIIRDILSGKGSHQFDLYFHFAPMKVEIDKDFPFAVLTYAPGANLAIIPLETSGLNISMEKGWVSPGYGVRTEAEVVKYTKNGQPPAIFCNILYPSRGKLNIQEIRAMAGKIDIDRLFGGKP